MGQCGTAGLDPPADGTVTPGEAVAWVVAIISALCLIDALRGGARMAGAASEAGEGTGAGEVPETANDPVVLRQTRRLRPLDRIGKGGDTEGMDAVVARVAPLLEPLPLLGDGDPDALQASLDAAFPWLAGLNRAAADALRATKGFGCDWYHAAPLLVVGPPGVGKTAWAWALAKRPGLPLAVLAAAGLSDNRALEDSARGWRNALPCLPALTMADHRCANPLILVDEIDKAGGSERNGDIRDTLLALLEPETARRHWDACLHGHLDLGWVTWVLTANHAGALPAALVSRCTVVAAGSPWPDHLPVIVEGVSARLARRYGVPSGMVPRLGDTDVARLTTAFRRHGSVRQVRRDVEAILGRLAWTHRAVAAADNRNITGSDGR